MENTEPDKIKYIHFTAKEFMQIWQQDYKGVHKEDSKGYWELFDNNGLSWAVFDGIEVTSEINLHSVQMPVLEIHNSKIANIKLDKSSCKQIAILNSQIDTLSFKNNTVVDYVNFNNVKLGLFDAENSFGLNCIITNCEQIGYIQIRNTTLNTIWVLNSKFESYQITNDCTITGDQKFSNATLTYLTFSETKCHNLDIDSNSNVKKLSVSASYFNNLKISKSNIENLTFSKDSYFSGNTIIENNAILGDISFQNSSNKWLSIINSVVGNIRFLNKSISGYLQINESTTGDIEFNNSTLTENLIIDQNAIVGNIRIESSNTIDLDISDSTLQNIYIKKSQTENIYINKSTTNTIYLFEDSTIGNLGISESKTADITLEKTAAGVFKLADSDCKEVNIRGKSKVFWFFINGKDCKKITLKNSYCQKLSWQQQTFSNININNCEIEYLKLKEGALPKDSIFHINNSFINRFEINSFINTAWIYLNNLKPLKNYERFEHDFKFDTSNLRLLDGKYSFQKSDLLTKIEFINSDLGKTSFVDCKLDQFDEFIFYNTKMLDVFVAGSTFPTKISLPQNIDKKEQKEQERLAFGQFKKIYENRGDSVSAGDYQALELEVYRQDLKEKNIKWRERANLYLNKISSNYGNDWLKATGMTFAITAIFYFIYLYLLGFRPGPDKEKAEYLISYFFEFLNPIRKGDFLDLEKYQPKYTDYQWIARTWDYFSRIVLAYFVYQTIQAFRRFGKKS